MDDDTQPMEAVKAGPIHSTEDPWSEQTWSYRDLDVALGYVTVEANHPQAPPDKPWLAYLTPINPRQTAFHGWFATAEEAKTYLDTIADFYRTQNAEAKA